MNENLINELEAERILIKRGINYDLSKDKFTGENTIFIPMFLNADKNKLNDAVAEYYRRQSRVDTSGFSSFLARAYTGEI